MNFINNDFLLQTDEAKHLYHNFAEISTISHVFLQTGADYVKINSYKLR